MSWREIFPDVVMIGSAMVVAYSIGVANTRAADKAAPVHVPDVPAWVTVEPCGPDGRATKAAPLFVLLDPSQLASISNPKESPVGCVRIVNGAGRGLFVVGTEEDIARRRNKALADRARLGLPAGSP